MLLKHITRHYVLICGRNDKHSGGRHSAARREVIQVNEKMSYTTLESISSKSEKEDLLNHGGKINFAPKHFLIINSNFCTVQRMNLVFANLLPSTIEILEDKNQWHSPGTQ